MCHKNYISQKVITSNLSSNAPTSRCPKQLVTVTTGDRIQVSVVAAECVAPAPPVCLWKREAFQTEQEQKDRCLCVGGGGDSVAIVQQWHNQTAGRQLRQRERWGERDCGEQRHIGFFVQLHKDKVMGDKLLWKQTEHKPDDSLYFYHQIQWQYQHNFELILSTNVLCISKAR